MLSATVVAQMHLTVVSRYRARVYAVMGTICSAAMSAGLFLGGVLADLTSPATVFIISGSGIAAAALIAFLTFSSDMTKIHDE